MILKQLTFQLQEVWNHIFLIGDSTLEDSWCVFSFSDIQNVNALEIIALGIN